MLERLVRCGVRCSYVLVNAVGYVVSEANKVFLGAYSMLANGSLISCVGTAIVAMMAHNHHVPVLVLCATHKFSQRVQLESLSFNELGDPDDLISTGRDNTRFGNVLRDWREAPNLKLLNLQYDLTPVAYLAMVITELGLIPATSVPVVLREYPPTTLSQSQDKSDPASRVRGGVSTVKPPPTPSPSFSMSM